MASADVIVIGQGYAGLMAAKHALERGLRVTQFEARVAGGLVVNVNELEPGPGPEGVAQVGAEVVSELAIQNMDAGVVSVAEEVRAVTPGPGECWTVTGEDASYEARHVIVASGARLRKLRVPGEDAFFGQGVSECADCDGPMFKGLDTVLVGGGDSAFQEAVALAQYARSIKILLRGVRPRAREDLVRRVAALPNVEVCTGTRVLTIEGSATRGVEAVRVETAGQVATFNVQGVFVFIGLEPNTGFLPAGVERDAAGAVTTDERRASSLPNLWAIGAARSGFAGMLGDAALDAQRVVASLA